MAFDYKATAKKYNQPPEEMHWGLAKSLGHPLTTDQRAEKQAYEREYRRRTGCDRRYWHEKKKHDTRLRIYGLTREGYQTLLEQQNHRCAICGGEEREKRDLAVDHDHETGKVRGLLCAKCNKAIGLLGESPSRVRTALEYLAKHNGDR